MATSFATHGGLSGPEAKAFAEKLKTNRAWVELRIYSNLSAAGGEALGEALKINP